MPCSLSGSTSLMIAFALLISEQIEPCQTARSALYRLFLRVTKRPKNGWLFVYSFVCSEQNGIWL